MLRRTARQDRVLALFGAGVLLLNPPIVNLFYGYVFGVPTLYLYFFGVWALMIGAVALICERGAGQAADGGRDTPPQ